MASKTEVANKAAMKLGLPRLSNIDTDNSPTAQALSGSWDSVRDSYLQSYPWNFAIKRADLAASTTEPVWGFDAKFDLPTDCLRVLDVKDVDNYVIEGRYVLANTNGPLYIKYISRVEDVSLWTPLFGDGFSTELAIETCDRLTDDQSKKQILLQMRKEIVERATSTDAIEDYPEYFDEDAWLIARL